MCWLCFNNELPCSSSTVFWFLCPAQMVTKWIPINQHVQCQEFVFGWPNHSRNYWGTIFQSLLHLMHHSVFFSNFLFDSNPPFSHRHYYERIENAYMNLFITFFLKICWPEILSYDESMFVAILIFLFFFLIYIYCSFIEMVCISN